jgi:hypothetical protein
MDDAPTSFALLMRLDRLNSCSQFIFISSCALALNPLELSAIFSCPLPLAALTKANEGKFPISVALADFDEFPLGAYSTYSCFVLSRHARLPDN